MLQELDRLEAGYTVHNSRITGRGLIDELKQLPAGIHVIEDADTLLDDKRAHGVLRSALWSQSQSRPPRRRIKWQTNNTKISFIFTGGIIIIANRDTGWAPEVRAMKRRLTVLELQVTADEIAALMRFLAADGFAYGEYRLKPEECRVVVEYIIRQCRELERPPDMRLLLHGFTDFIQHRRGMPRPTGRS